MRRLTPALLGATLLALTFSPAAYASKRTDFVSNMPVKAESNDSRYHVQKVTIPYFDANAEEGVSPATALVEFSDLPPFRNLGKEDILNIRVLRYHGNRAEELFTLRDTGWDGMGAMGDQIIDYTRRDADGSPWSVSRSSPLEKKKEGKDLAVKVLDTIVDSYNGGTLTGTAGQ